MLAKSRQIHDLDDLRNYVNEIMCDHDQLLMDAFPITQRILIRGGKPCGIFFCLHGPRSVKITAIWETDRNTILFYNSAGERFHRTQLQAAPALHEAVATPAG